MPTEPLFDAKKTLRKTVRDELKQLSEEQMIIESKPIYSRGGAEGSDKCLFAPLVLDNASNMKMLQIADLIAYAFVRATEQLDDLVKSSYGILEPAETDSTGTKRVEALEADEPLDLLLMPGAHGVAIVLTIIANPDNLLDGYVEEAGLAFDSHGNRLGRGGGYYDNYLRACLERARERDWKPPMLVALAYSPQIRDSVPMDPHDRPVDFVVCADQVILGAPTS
eukprot:gene3051-3876_t